MDEEGSEGAVQSLRRERDLLERLLDIGTIDDPVGFLHEALAVCVDRVDALRGYIALLHPEDSPSAPRWWHAVDCGDVEISQLQRAFSTGLVAEAVRQGQTVLIANALLDPAWSARESIRRNAVEAVICGPIGVEAPCGVLYLQRRPGGEPFAPEDVARVERLASWLAPIARRLLSAAGPADPTAGLRMKLDVADLVGRSEAMAHLLGQVQLAARYQVAVLLTGPTGSGKTAVARAITRNSPRADAPFVELNCASLRDELLAAQMFGASPGSYTGAPATGGEGLVAAAEGGTLFLDEIGDLSAAGQAALLHFLEEEQVYRRLGETRTRRANVRVIAATNVDLRQAVGQGRFREDLYQRLSTLVVRVPGLDERPEDVEPLAEHLVLRAAARHHVPARPFTPAALRLLQQSTWAGHIRELAKAVEVGLIRADARDVPRIGVEELQAEGRGGDVPETWQAATRRFQYELLRGTLEATDGDLHEAMQRLDLSRGHLYKLLSVHGLDRER
jgi:Nif-specific regulatory protein